MCTFLAIYAISWIYNIVLRNVRIRNEIFEFHNLAKECFFGILFRYINSKTNGDRTGKGVYVSAVLPFINIFAIGEKLWFSCHIQCI